MSIFDPVQSAVDWLTYGLLSLEKGSRIAESLNFFLFDSIKIIALLLAINYVMAVINHYIPMEKIRDFLASRNWHGFDYFLAAVLGLVTPFCTCSSIPLFVGFLGAGIPLGVTMTFLVSSPLLSETAIIMLGGILGIKIMIIYIIAGIFVSMIAGFLLRNVDPKKHISPDILALSEVKQATVQKVKKFRKQHLKTWLDEAWGLSRKLIPYVLFGVAAGAVIHNLVPAELLARIVGNNYWWSIPVATIISVPIYANAVGIIPVVEALVAKGVAIGTAMVVLMATIGLSLPEALILKKVMSLKLLLAFFGIVAFGIMTIGYLINIII